MFPPSTVFLAALQSTARKCSLALQGQMLRCSALQGLGTKKTLCSIEILWFWALQGYVAMGTAGILWVWALQGQSAVGCCRNTQLVLLVTARIRCGWGYSAVGHCRDALLLRAAGMLCLSTAGVLGGWALQGYFAVGHRRDTLRLGTAGICAMQRCSQAPRGGRAQHRLLKSARVGKQASE